MRNQIHQENLSGRDDRSALGLVGHKVSSAVHPRQPARRRVPTATPQAVSRFFNTPPPPPDTFEAVSDQETQRLLTAGCNDHLSDLFGHAA
jgi:hypothetical protein